MPTTHGNKPEISISINDKAEVRFSVPNECAVGSNSGALITLTQPQVEALGDFLRLTEPLWKP